MSGNYSSGGCVHVIGDYRILGCIGEGTFSRVHIAKKANCPQDICVKIINKKTIQTQQDMSHLRREVNILNEIKHENIVKFYDFFEDSEHYYIFMEYCHGESLQEIIERATRLHLDFVKLIIQQILKALVFLHEKGIAHRDLKPENIIVDRANHVKIIDFGLASDRAGSLSETYCGSLIYAAPECIRHTPYIPAKADIWSAGIILYAMIFGSFPWKNKSVTGLVKEIACCDVRIPKTIPHDVLAVFDQMLEKDPSIRSDAKDLLDNNWFKEHTFSPSQPSSPNTSYRRKVVVVKTANAICPIITPTKRRSTYKIHNPMKLGSSMH